MEIKQIVETTTDVCMATMHDIILYDIIIYDVITANFSEYFLYFLLFAPTASILNQFSQTRFHFKAENLLFPTMYELL